MLAIHSLNGRITGIETGVIDKRKSLRIPRVGVTHDLGCLENDTKGTEDIVEQFFVNFRVQIANEDICANI